MDSWVHMDPNGFNLVELEIVISPEPKLSSARKSHFVPSWAQLINFQFFGAWTKSSSDFNTHKKITSGASPAQTFWLQPAQAQFSMVHWCLAKPGMSISNVKYFFLDLVFS